MNVINVVTSIVLLFYKYEGVSTLEDASFWSDVGKRELDAALLVKHNTGIAKNVVVFVGDGMGLNTATAARIYRGQQKQEGKDAELGALVFEKFPHLALLKTYSVDRQVPDSACSATALFCGVKANYETSGVDANVARGDCEASLNTSTHVSSIIKWAQDAGKLTGFVTTTRVTHATPSALYAHAANRGWECDATIPAGSRERCKDIARQMVEDEPGRSIRVIMGGGRQCLTFNYTNTPEDPVDTWSCQRADNLDLFSTWRAHKETLGVKYVEVSDTAGLRAIDPANTEFVLGVFANGHIKYEHERSNSTPSLAEMTRSAVQILQQQQTQGYLLVVEGGLIDQAHHRGTAKRALNEVISMEAAVQEVLDLTNPEDTLIVVTADHAHTLSISGYPPRGNDILGVAQTSKTDGMGYTTLSYATGTAIKYQVYNSSHVSRTDPALEDLTSFTYEQHAAVPQDEETHGGGDVALYAQGPMAHLFHTLHEQNYVAYVIAYASKIGPYAQSSASKLYTKSSASFIYPSMITLMISFLYARKQLVLS